MAPGCVGPWVSEQWSRIAGSELLFPNTVLLDLQGVDEREWRPPLPSPRAKPSVAS